MVRHNRIGNRIREFDIRDDLGTEPRMQAHFLHFLRGERSGLVENVFRNGQLADIVKQRRRGNRFDFPLIQMHPFRDRSRIPLHALNVPVGVSVSRINGEREGRESRVEELSHLG